MKPPKVAGPLGGIEYFLDPARHKGIEPVLLSGDIETTKKLLLASDSKNPYTTGVLSFAKEESDISDELKEFLMVSFEETLLCGLEKNQYDITWIEHRDKDRLELNFHIVNTELQTGKQLVPYLHQKDCKRMNAWKSLQNDLHNLANPDAPERKRMLKFDNKYQDIKKEIHEHLDSLWLEGEINNRNELLEELKNIDWITITKKTKKSISVLVDGMNKPFRLTGELYNEQLRTCEEFVEAKEDRQRKFDSARNGRIESNKKTIAELSEKLSDYRREKYSITEQEKQIQSEMAISIVREYKLASVKPDISSDNVQDSYRKIREQLQSMQQIPSRQRDSESVLQIINNNNENKENGTGFDRNFNTRLRAVAVAIRSAVQRIKSAFEFDRAQREREQTERIERINEQIRSRSKQKLRERSNDRDLHVARAEEQPVQDLPVCKNGRKPDQDGIHI